MMATGGSADLCLSYRCNKERNFLLVMRTLRVCSLASFLASPAWEWELRLRPRGPRAGLSSAWKLESWTTFPFPQSPPRATSGNHKSDLFFYEFGFFFFVLF